MKKRSLIISISGVLAFILISSIVLNVLILLKLRKNTKTNETSIVETSYSKEEFLDLLTKNDSDFKLEIPIIEINTENEQFPYDKENYINCSFSLSNTQDDIYNIQKKMKESYKSDGGVGIRLRGNSTMQMPKKPFRIKFNEKTSLMGLPENKNWVLLADYNAKGSARTLNYSAFTLASWLDNLDYTPTPNHVVVFINNKFQGLYLLTEQIEVNNGRVPVKSSFDVEQCKEFPFLIEGFVLTQDEKTFDISDRLSIEVKYPDQEDYDENFDKIKNYIEEYMKAVWETLKNGNKVEVSFRDESVGFEDLVDVDSLIDLYLVNEIMENAEGMSRSVYMHKNIDGKLKFGPAWDFDIQFESVNIGIKGKELLCCQYSEFMKQFMMNEKYYKLVVTRYQEIKHLIDDLYKLLVEYQPKIDKVASIDSLYWYGDFKLYNYGYDSVKARLMDRKFLIEDKYSLEHQDFKNLLEQEAPYIW